VEIPRIHHLFHAAGEAEMRLVVADTAGEVVVIRVIGILLLARLIDVIGIAVGPGFNAPRTGGTPVQDAFSHACVRAV
jgi:hypothetical protein